MRNQIGATSVLGWIACVLLSFTIYFSLSFVQLRYGELGQFYADTQVMSDSQLQDKYGDLWNTLESGWMLDDWVFLPLTAFSVGIVAGLLGVRRAGLLAMLGFLPLTLFLLLSGFDLRTLLFVSFYFAITIATAEGLAWIRRTMRSTSL